MFKYSQLIHNDVVLWINQLSVHAVVEYNMETRIFFQQHMLFS